MTILKFVGVSGCLAAHGPFTIGFCCGYSWCFMCGARNNSSHSAVLHPPSFLHFLLSFHSFPGRDGCLNICWITSAYKRTINEWKVGKLLKLKVHCQVKDYNVLLLLPASTFAFNSIVSKPQVLFFSEPSVMTTSTLKLEIEKEIGNTIAKRNQLVSALLVILCSNRFILSE